MKGGLGSVKEEVHVLAEPVEKQKMGIVNTLIGMSDQIRQFSQNIESKLDQAHKQSGKFEKKHGVGKQNFTNIDEILEAHSIRSQQEKQEKSKSRDAFRGAQS